MKSAAKLAWAKFYFSDWRSDPCLRMCCYGARGLWMEMLGIMHEATPYGHLLINGVAPNMQQLASVAGGSIDETTSCLAELERAGVFSRNRASVIYSRRMTRTAKKVATARTNGRKGGNPALMPAAESCVNLAQIERYEGDNHEITFDKSSKNDELASPASHCDDSVNRPLDNLNQTNEVKTQRLEARVYIDRRKKEYRSASPHSSDMTKAPEARKSDVSSGGADPDPAIEMFAIWREHWGTLWPRVAKLDKQRAQSLRLRLHDEFDDSLETWRTFCTTCRQIPFLIGDGPKRRNGEPWKAPLDFLLRRSAIKKITEGEYGDAIPARGLGNHVNGSDHQRRRPTSPHDALLAGFAAALGDRADEAGDR